MEKELAPSNEWLQTYTGKAFFPLAAHVEDIDARDIAHSLANQCRYNGHTRIFYSVAEHCVLMSYCVPEQDALWALLHDAPEAYVGDLIRPLKRNLPLYVEIEDRIMDVICEKFMLHQTFMPDSVREADNRIIENERYALLRTPPLEWVANGEALPDIEVTGWHPQKAEFEYYKRLGVLLAERDIREQAKLKQANRDFFEESRKDQSVDVGGWEDH